MANTDNMDSVFDANSEAELDFDTIFGDEEDSIIDTVNGVDADGNSLLGESDNLIGDKLDDPTDMDDNKVDIEGTDKKDLEYGAEDGDTNIGKNKTSAERNAYDDEISVKQFKNEACGCKREGEGNQEGFDDVSPDGDEADTDEGGKLDESVDLDDFFEAADISSDSSTRGGGSNDDQPVSECGCGKPECKICNPSGDAPKDAEGTKETDMDGDALVDKEEENQEVEDLDNTLVDESYLDPDEFLISESDIEEMEDDDEDDDDDDEDYSEELDDVEDIEDDEAEDESCKEYVDFSAAPLLGIEPRQESDTVDYAEDEIIDTVDKNNGGSNINLDYDPSVDEEIIEDLL